MTKDSTEPKAFLTLTEAAARFKLSVPYLRNIAASGRLKAHKIGRDWVTTEADVREYLRTREKKGAYRKDIRP